MNTTYLQKMESDLQIENQFFEGKQKQEEHTKEKGMEL